MILGLLGVVFCVGFMVTLCFLARQIVGANYPKF